MTTLDFEWPRQEWPLCGLPKGSETRESSIEDSIATIQNTNTTFDNLVLTLYPSVYTFALRLTNNIEAASDLTQEAMLRAYRSTVRTAVCIETKAWYYKVTYHCFLDQLRYSSTRPTLVSADSFAAECGEMEWADESANAETRMINDQLSPAMLAALRSLSDQQRELIHLAVMEGLSHVELAKIFRCGPTTIKTRIHRAKALLKSRLQIAVPNSPTEARTI